MTDHLSDLDERGRTAAADLRARATARPMPPFDADAPLRLPAPAPNGAGRPRRPLLAVAAVLVLVAGAAVWMTTRAGHDDDSTPVAVANGEVLPFLATDLPDGFELAGVSDAAPTPAEGSPEYRPLLVFGPTEGDPGLGVTYQPRFALDDVAAGQPVDVGGRTAYAYDDVGLGRHALVLPAGKGRILASSPTLQRADLARILGGTSLAGNGVTVDADVLPDGWQKLGEVPDALGVSSPVSLARNGEAGPAFLASYARADGAFLAVSSGPGDEVSVQAPALFGTETSSVTVQGRPGSLTYDGVGFIVSWLQSPGVLVRVSSFGGDRADVLSVAEGVRPVTEPGRWADMLGRTEPGDIGPGEVSADGFTYQDVGSGQFADGTAWHLEAGLADTAGPGTESSEGPYVQPRLEVTLDEPDQAGSSGISAGEGDVLDGVFLANQTLDQGGRYFAAGILGDRVVAVELRRPDGSVIGRAEVVGRAELADGPGFKGWVAELTEDPTVAVALDADGEELDRITLTLDGNESPEISEDSTPGG